MSLGLQVLSPSEPAGLARAQWAPRNPLRLPPDGGRSKQKALTRRIAVCGTEIHIWLTVFCFLRKSSPMSRPNPVVSHRTVASAPGQVPHRSGTRPIQQTHPAVELKDWWLKGNREAPNMLYLKGSVRARGAQSASKSWWRGDIPWKLIRTCST